MKYTPASIAALALTLMLMVDIAQGNSDEPRTEDQLLDLIREIEAKVAEAELIAEELADRIPGDLDGDGDVDGADYQIMLANWTAPTDPPPEPEPEPGEGFYEIDLSDAVLLPATATLEDIQNALNGDKTVAIAAGTQYTGSLTLPDSTERLAVHGTGPRPILNVPAGRNGIEITNSRTDEIAIQGLEVRGPPLPHLGRNQGIRLRINSREGKYAKKVVLSDIKVAGFDTNIEIVDDWARTQRDENGEPIPTQPGRIGLRIERCLIGPSYGSDSHSVGLYAEGLEQGTITETTLDHAGWRPGHPEDRNKRSHNIYAQTFNGPITVEGSILTRSAANAMQLRAGGTIKDCLISECSLGPWVSQRPTTITGTLIIDQTDIDETPEGWRGHGFMGGWVFRDNIAARRNGSLGNQPAFNAWTGATLENNIAAEWHQDGLNFQTADGLKENIGTNRTTTLAPDAPKFTEDNIRFHMERPRAKWSKQYETAGFIEAFREHLR